MSTIQSGVDSTVLTVDPTSKAARVTLYDSLGNELIVQPTGCYFSSFYMRQTGTTASGSTVFALRNGATKTVRVRRLKVTLTFDGTAAATTTARYQMKRFSAATPTGGTSLGAGVKRTSYAASSVADIRQLDTGLTVAGVTFETTSPFFWALPISATSAASVQDFVFEGLAENYGCFELAANEGFAIQLAATAVIGQGIWGTVFWDEL